MATVMASTRSPMNLSAVLLSNSDIFPVILHLARGRRAVVTAASALALLASVMAMVDILFVVFPRKELECGKV